MKQAFVKAFVSSIATSIHIKGQPVIMTALAFYNWEARIIQNIYLQRLDQ